MIGVKELVQRTGRWIDRRATLRPAAHAMRELLPGDSRFGDPLSTAGADPHQVVARRVWSLNDTRWSMLGEMALGALQVADWLGGDVRTGIREDDTAILFTDLVGFSSWALQVGDERSLHVLRSIDSVVNAAVLEHDGQMIKRLGDGIMAVFPSADQALSAASWALRGSPAVDYDGYTARMRAGIHFGTPRPIGGDYIGVDVNIAARLCEAAEPNEVLVSKAVQKRIEKGDPNLTACGYRELVGVPDGLETFSLRIAASAGEAESTRRPA